MGGGQDTARAWLSERLFFFFLVQGAPSPVSRVKSDLLEVGISEHGADRCDQDDEIYLMVQEIWSGSSTFKGETVFKGGLSGKRGLHP